MANHCEGLVARPDGSLVRARVRFADRIAAIEASSVAPDDYVLPGFIDLQVNGAAGIDVMATDAEGLLAIAHALAHEGTTGWLPTAITAPLDRIEQVDQVVAEAMASQEHSAERRGGYLRGKRGATILGMHLEGPFIAPTRLGAHPRHNLVFDDDAALDRVLALESLRLLTLAPELDGALEAIRRLNADRVAVSMGHSEASLEQARAGIDAGAVMFTHVFNAMGPLHHRAPSISGAALTSRAYAAIIPDGVHVHPEMLRLVWRVRGASGIVLTSDRVALAGIDGAATPMTGALAGTHVREGAARLADGTLAGSLITMLEGVRLMVEQVGVGIAEAALMASTNPAQVLGRKGLGRIERGAPADLILLDRELKLKAVFVWGREID